MVERKISSSQDIKEKYQKSGIVIFIMSQEGEILLVKENTANPTTGREIGNYGVICETSNENEDWETREKEIEMQTVTKCKGCGKALTKRQIKLGQEYCGVCVR